MCVGVIIAYLLLSCLTLNIRSQQLDYNFYHFFSYKGYTDIAKALRVTAKKVFCKKCGIRPGVRNIALVITDGISNHGSSAEAAAQMMKVYHEVS